MDKEITMDETFMTLWEAFEAILPIRNPTRRERHLRESFHQFRHLVRDEGWKAEDILRAGHAFLEALDNDEVEPLFLSTFIGRKDINGRWRFEMFTKGRSQHRRV